MRGAVLLKEQLGSRVSIYTTSISTSSFVFEGTLRARPTDGDPVSPAESLLRSAAWLRRAARGVASLARASRGWRAPGESTSRRLPVGYLVGPTKLNDDPTNYWVFTPAGLERLVRRAGWEIVSTLNVGDTATSITGFE